MQIDWLTVAAQIVNFLALVWLLQRFLYQPITKAMHRREARIVERLAQADSTRRQAEDEKQRTRQKQAELEASVQLVLDAARDEAAALRQRLEAEIREEMDEKRRNWHRHLAEERHGIVTSLRRQAGHQLLAVTQRVLRDYADSDLADRVATTFIERLRHLDPTMIEKMSETAAEEGERALVQTSPAIENATKARITRAIHQLLSADIDVEYREEEEMILGVRLTIGDQTVEWSALRHLGRLETEFGEILDASSPPIGEGSRGNTGNPENRKPA